MTLPVTLDPRYHDAVIFNLNAVLADTDGGPVFESTVNLVRKLLDVGVATAVYSLHPGGQQLLKAAGIDDLFGVCVDGVPAAALVKTTPPTRCASATVCRRRRCRCRGSGGPRRRFRARRRCGPRGACRPTNGTRRRRRGCRPGGCRCSHGRQADVGAPRCGGVIRSNSRCSGRPRTGVVSRLRRNVIRYRCRSQRRRPRRRSGQGAGEYGVTMPRGHPEWTRSRRYPQPSSDTGYLVRGQPRLRADGTGRHLSPKRNRPRRRRCPRTCGGRVRRDPGGNFRSTGGTQAIRRRGSLSSGRTAAHQRDRVCHT